MLLKGIVRLGVLQLAQEGIPLGRDLLCRLPMLILLLDETLLGLAGGVLGAAPEIVDFARLLDDFGGCGLEVEVQSVLFLL